MEIRHGKLYKAQKKKKLDFVFPTEKKDKENIDFFSW